MKLRLVVLAAFAAALIASLPVALAGSGADPGVSATTIVIGGTSPLTGPAASYASVARGAKVLWLQEGIANDDARRIGEAGGLSVVMGVCMRQESRRLEGSERET